MGLQKKMGIGRTETAWGGRVACWQGMADQGKLGRVVWACLGYIFDTDLSQFGTGSSRHSRSIMHRSDSIVTVTLYCFAHVSNSSALRKVLLKNAPVLIETPHVLFFTNGVYCTVVMTTVPKYKQVR